MSQRFFVFDFILINKLRLVWGTFLLCDFFSIIFFFRKYFFHSMHFKTGKSHTCTDTHKANWFVFSPLRSWNLDFIVIGFFFWLHSFLYDKTFICLLAYSNASLFVYIVKVVGFAWSLYVRCCFVRCYYFVLNDSLQKRSTFFLCRNKIKNGCFIT